MKHNKQALRSNPLASKRDEASKALNRVLESEDGRKVFEFIEYLCQFQSPTIVQGEAGIDVNATLIRGSKQDVFKELKSLTTKKEER